MSHSNNIPPSSRDVPQPYTHFLTRREKTEVLDKLEFEVLELNGQNMEEHTQYAEEVLNIDLVLNLVNDVDLPSALEGLQRKPMRYVCSHCGGVVWGIVVARCMPTATHWLVCPGCGKGSVANDGTVVPVSLLGENIKGLPDTIKGAYIEARRSITSESYTACELMCRKILMNVAVEKGAEKGLGFTSYVDYLIKHNYVTTMMKWVDQIRKNGNEAAHEIHAPDSERADITFRFTMLFLRNVYEAEAIMKKQSIKENMDRITEMVRDATFPKGTFKAV